MDWSTIGSPLAEVRAFLLEKKGDLKGAVDAYQEILKESTASGWMGNSSITDGRAALAALAYGDDTPALQLSKETLAEDPGANVALAKVLEKKGDKNGAKERYKTALKLMSDGLRTSNWNLPLYFAEHKSAQDGAAK
jgi:tetratricopeptide (TPR) repeat protein